MSAGKWENRDLVATLEESPFAGTIRAPDGYVVVVNGVIHPERVVQIRPGDRVEFRRR